MADYNNTQFGWNGEGEYKIWEYECGAETEQEHTKKWWRYAPLTSAQHFSSVLELAAALHLFDGRQSAKQKARPAKRYQIVALKCDARLDE